MEDAVFKGGGRQAISKLDISAYHERVKMKVYTGKGLGDIYLSVFRDLKANGVLVHPRGQNCIEMPEPVTFVYEKPGYCWMCIPGRRMNPFFALAEVVWILSGRGDIDWIAKYNAKMRDFNDGGLENHGAYGLRIRRWNVTSNSNWAVTPVVELQEVDQLAQVVRKLKGDPYSRQAVISLWDPVRDNLIKSKDIPCNNWVGYKLRQNNPLFWTLDQTVVIRSNDLVWGCPYNAVQFTHLHALVAGMLGAEMGTLTYVIQNLHYYTDLYPEALGAIEEAAATMGNVGAQKVERFGPVTQEGFDVTKRLVPVFDSASSENYWTQTIPLMIWIHDAIKFANRDSYSSGHSRFVAKSIAELPHIFQVLTEDFYRGTKNEFAQDMMRDYKAFFQPD
jgi:thymidylate synthase